RYRLILRVLPRFEPNCTAEDRIEMLRDISRSEYVLITCSSELVDDHAVISGEAGCGCNFGVGYCPDADHDDVDLNGVSVRRLERTAGAVRFDRTYRGIQPKFDSIAAMQFGDVAPTSAGSARESG